ncbi:MAG: class I SAM-dependent methyltransferase [Desulfovibrio sp.]|nr:MAG: class I SAM-dependent methyltransferase [Desulfovibrio sp.]
MHVEYVTFSERKSRIEYVAQRFAPQLTGRVADIGCDQAYLREIRPDLDYTGVDLSEAADIQLNLETGLPLPFSDNSFNCVICIDVLEHLDSLHQVFEEIMRVTAKHAVISWHNCWVNARKPLERGRGSFSHYGLPVERPVDRHKWFFNITQAREFSHARARAMNLAITEEFVTDKPRPASIRGLRRLLYPRQEAYLNRYAHTLWTVFSKTG